MGAKESYLETLTKDPKKTTVAPCSLRGRPEPTVAAPRTWAELTAPGLAHLTYREVLERVAAGIDPLASLLTRQCRPSRRRSGVGCAAEIVEAPRNRRPSVRAAGPRAVRPLTTEDPKAKTRRRPSTAGVAPVAAAASLPADRAGPGRWSSSWLGRNSRCRGRTRWPEGVCTS